ncbi:MULTISPECIES: MazG family protein [Microbacterium]|uniref:MazG family protein n=1 Tax=Microbacterium TaxID=33882 RepID=UPI00070045B7|nr:nucleoside triphosphate hydrolase [Microbacterium sp. Root322]
MQGGSVSSESPAAADAADPLRQAAETMHAVRERCVWSQRITHRDLVPYLIEESHEVIDAVESGSRDDLREELGDLLWQVLFHSAIAAQDPDDPFDIDDVARTLTEKMVRRHPHVFAGEVAETPEQVLVHWNAAKAAEKRTRRSVLDGVPRGMPALALAQKLAGRAAGVGVAVESAAAPSSEDELGEALLALVATARAQGWDAERALRERLRVLEDDVRVAEAAS